MYRPRMSFLSQSGRYLVVVLGLLGLFTSVQLACTFSDDPPAKKQNNPVTDSGPTRPEGTSSGTVETSSGGYYGYGYYGYGYGPDGCYGYGYGYTYDPSPYGYGTGYGTGCP